VISKIVKICDRGLDVLGPFGLLGTTKKGGSKVKEHPDNAFIRWIRRKMREEYSFRQMDDAFVKVVFLVRKNEPVRQQARKIMEMSTAFRVRPRY